MKITHIKSLHQSQKLLSCLLHFKKKSWRGNIVITIFWCVRVCLSICEHNANQSVRPILIGSLMKSYIPYWFWPNWNCIVVQISRLRWHLFIFLSSSSSCDGVIMTSCVVLFRTLHIYSSSYSLPMYSKIRAV